MIVVDASLAVKWYIDEAFSDEAELLLRGNIGNIAVPEIFMTEVVGALVRRANVDKSLRPGSERSIAQFGSLFADGVVAVVASKPAKIAGAAKLALDLGHPLKDCLYLALAMDLGCPLVTCDTKFAAKARSIYAGVRVLEEGVD